MPTPSRRKAVPRIKKGRSVKSLNFKKKILTRPLIKCSKCQKDKLLHFTCSNCNATTIT